MMARYTTLIYLFIILLLGNLKAQGDCISFVGGIYSAPNDNARAKCLIPTLAKDGFYAVAMKADSVLIFKFDPAGKVIWSRTFDIVPGKTDHVSAAILDSEGMLLVAGISGDYINGGSVFGCRYNPETQEILWANEYVNPDVRNYSFAVAQKGIGGNFVFANNPHPIPGTSNDDELLEIDKNTGDVIPGFSKNYDLGGSDHLSEIVYFQNYLYGIGRFTDGLPNDRMRHALGKVDLNTGAYVWIKMGHVAGNQSARLYGKDLVIDNDQLFSLYSGDPAGASATNTSLYIQKTDLNGNLLWLNQYDLPGNNDVAHQMVKSGNGFVILAMKNAYPGEIILFKIDEEGTLLWSKSILFSASINSVEIDRGNSQIIALDDHLIFTATGTHTDGSTDILIARADLNGDFDLPCMLSAPIPVSVVPVLNPSFYSINPTEFDATYEVFPEAPEPVSTNIIPLEECIKRDTLYAWIDTSICKGAVYSGYTASGVYQDTFQSMDGCDSIRNLNLTVTNEFTTTVNIQICLGDAYFGISAPGIYTDTLQTAHGCDSIIVLHVEVIPQQKTQIVAICPGGNFEQYFLPGMYIDTVHGADSPCDTIRYITVIGLPATETLVEKVICSGDSYLGYTAQGIYTDTLVSAKGCDTVRTVALTVADVVFTHIETSVCDAINSGHASAGTFIDTLVSSGGCDSVRTLVLHGVSDYIPNIFSPNNDGINDLFVISNIHANALQLDYFGIFDRFGNMAYETNQWPIEWDGKNLKEVPFSSGVFAYVFIYYCGNQKVVEHGDITVIR